MQHPPPEFVSPRLIFSGAMTRNSPPKDWFFPIEEAPVLATVTRKGGPANVRVPHKKALVAADTGHISRGNTMTDIASHPPKIPQFPPFDLPG